eukprot:6545649-Karenia_brevis.AAC.1
MEELDVEFLRFAATHFAGVSLDVEGERSMGVVATFFPAAWGELDQEHLPVIKGRALRSSFL